MTFGEFYFKTVGISLSDAKARKVTDLEIMEQAYEAGRLSAFYESADMVRDYEGDPHAEEEFFEQLEKLIRNSG
jgi:hypothetical protein